jgi:poly-gamma-glutamate synthase PgsB/CapB
MTESQRLDPLRERLLAEELRQARELAAQGGAVALLASAVANIATCADKQSRLRVMAERLESVEAAARNELIADFLAATVSDPDALAQDLRALRRGKGRLLDLATLTERTAREVLALELQAEACIVVAQASLDGPVASDQLSHILTLAGAPGRWSRQVQALVLLRRAARRELGPIERAEAVAKLEVLIRPDAPRWVQPAALDTLAFIDEARALQLARERLARDAGGDDFIVRSRIVELCAKHHKRGWQALLSLVRKDPSELVRCCVVRAEQSGVELQQLARADPSHRVRALALLKLRRRFAVAAETDLQHALAEDPHAFVVETAARELAALCRLRPTASGAQAIAALGRALDRHDLPAAVRALCREMLLEVDVLTSGAEELRRALAPAFQAAKVGGSRVVQDAALVRATDNDLAKALAVLARDDFGIGLVRTPRRAIVFRGEQRRFSLWRLLFELSHPGSSKRQAFNHTVAWRAAGDLRSHPQGMAEVTATNVPGERVLVSEAGEWGRHLPLVEDLLSLKLIYASDLRLASAHGVTLVRGPATLSGRLKARFKLVWGYARFARLRQRALASPEAHVRAAYAEEIQQQTGISMRLVPHLAGDQATSELPSGHASTVLSGRVALSVLLPFFGNDGQGTPGLSLPGLWEELSSYAASPGGNRLSHLAGFAILMLGAMTLRAASIRHSVDGDRRSIPLVIGGWGTRGKSGTERLKAAFFQGMGYECLVKTTGCEAMFIHAIPGVTAREVFIYRPYDKATVWEQRDVLSLARKLKVKVFLWECMALQPELVSLLQAQWMRDDYSTITNTYPDHEDVQGPTGFDVATTISEFVPRAGRLFTSEEQMLPLLREQARARSSRLTVVSARDAELVPEDLLGRFGHAEHPRNVALVLRLARSLGVSATVALTEMADNVVPDLGVLKTYGPVNWHGRSLSFTNGMGANDRAGTLGNWERSGFASYDPVAEPGRWLVTVVNNRADRVARSEVFAKLLVEDVSAHRHVLIGTNVVGLLGLIERALAAHLTRLSLVVDLPNGRNERRSLVRERVARALGRLLLVDLGVQSALAEAGLALRADLVARLEPLLLPTSSNEQPSQGLRIVAAGLNGSVAGDSLPFLTAAIARRRAARTLFLAVEQRFDTEPESVDELFKASYRALFLQSIVTVHDYRISGDALISLIAGAVPPGACAALIGMQNIKGTGLDFVYRWISIDFVQRLLSELASAEAAARADVLNKLLVHADYGTIDASTALERLLELQAQHADSEQPVFSAAIKRLTSLVERANARAQSGDQSPFSMHLRKFARSSLDFIDSIVRRRRAEQVVAELVDGRISHAVAAQEMRTLIARGKARGA